MIHFLAGPRNAVVKRVCTPMTDWDMTRPSPFELYPQMQPLLYIQSKEGLCGTRRAQGSVQSME